MKLLTELVLFLTVTILYEVDSLEEGSTSENTIKEFFDREINQSVTQIINSRGYSVEEHDVITEDGYILTIQRIVNPLLSKRERKNSRPIILMHGLMGSSADWVINSDNVEPKISTSTTMVISNSLAFTLSNHQFDVWLGTMRGSVNGQRHQTLSLNDPEFWNFSQDEHIKFDLPAIIEFVQRVSKKTRIGYVGFSHGSLMAFGFLSENPDYGQVLVPFIALSPLPVVHKMNTIFMKDFSSLTKNLQEIHGSALKNPIAIRFLKMLVCGLRIFNSVCTNFLYMIFGFNAVKIDKKHYKDYIEYLPAGTSVKSLLHYGQAIRKKNKLSYFDYQRYSENELKYGSRDVKNYPLENINTPHIFLFHSKKDWLSTPEEVEYIKKQLIIPRHDFLIPDWNHFDYLYSKKCGERINSHVLDILNSYRIFERIKSDSESD